MTAERTSPSRRAPAVALAALLLAGALACGRGPAHPGAVVRYQDDVITADEIERSSAENVLVLVQRAGRTGSAAAAARASSTRGS